MDPTSGPKVSGVRDVGARKFSEGFVEFTSEFGNLELEVPAQ
jgi:hypothetical protein